MAESLFDVFDEDKSGALNFYEFMLVKVDMSMNVISTKFNIEYHKMGSTNIKCICIMYSKRQSSNNFK